MEPADESQNDPFKPPKIPTLVRCIHCDREYESYLIRWVEEIVNGEVKGFWCCPTPDCGGMGFGFDIFPVDPDYRDENGNPMGFMLDDDEEELEDDEELYTELDLDSLSSEPDEDEPPPEGGERMPF